MKGIISVFLILAIIHTHGAPMDKSEWLAAIEKLQKERDQAIQKPSRAPQNLNNVNDSPHSDHLQWYLRNVKYRNVQSNNQGKRPPNLLWSQNKQSDSSDSDSDGDRSAWISANRKILRRKISTKESSTEEDSAETKSDESIVRKRNSDEKDSRERSLDKSGHRREKSDDDTDSSDDGSSSGSTNRDSRRRKHLPRERKGKRESTEHGSRKRSSLWSESSGESESDEEEFEQYLRNVLQKRQHQKEIIQMLRNRNVEERDNLSGTEVYYNRLYKWNRDKFVEWKKKIELKNVLLSEKDNFSKERLKHLCNISEETEEDLEEDRLKRCVKIHMSTNDRFDIATSLSGNHASRSDRRQAKKTARVEKENDVKADKVSVLVNKTPDNDQSTRVEVEKEKEEASEISTEKKVVNKVLDKDSRTVTIATGNNHGQSIDTISKATDISRSDQAGERLPGNDNNGNPSNVQNTGEEENPNATNEAKLGNDEGEAAKSSSQNNVDDTSFNSGTVLAEGGSGISSNKETADQGSSTLNNVQGSSNGNKEEADSSIGASQNGGLPVAHEEQGTQAANVQDNGEKSDDNARGSTALMNDGTESTGEIQNQPKEPASAPEAATVKVSIVESETVGSDDKTSGDGESNLNITGNETQENDQSVTSNSEDNGSVTEPTKANTALDDNERSTSGPDATNGANSTGEQTESSGTTEEQASEAPSSKTKTVLENNNLTLTENDGIVTESSEALGDDGKPTSDVDGSKSSDNDTSGLERTEVQSSQTEGSEVTEGHVAEIPVANGDVNVDNSVTVAVEANDVSNKKTDPIAKESTLTSELESTSAPQRDDASVTKEVNLGSVPLDVNVQDNAVMGQENDAVNSDDEQSNSSVSESVTLSKEEAASSNSQGEDSNAQKTDKDVTLKPGVAIGANGSNDANTVVDANSVQAGSVSEQADSNVTNNVAPEDEQPATPVAQHDASATETKTEAESSSSTLETADDGNVDMSDSVAVTVETSNLLDSNQESSDTVEQQSGSSTEESTKQSSVSESVTLSKEEAASSNSQGEDSNAQKTDKDVTLKPGVAIDADGSNDANTVVDANSVQAGSVSEQADSNVTNNVAPEDEQPATPVAQHDASATETKTEAESSSSTLETADDGNVDMSDSVAVTVETSNLLDSNQESSDTVEQQSGSSTEESTKRSSTAESTKPDEETTSGSETGNSRVTEAVQVTDEATSESELAIVRDRVDASTDIGITVKENNAAETNDEVSNSASQQAGSTLDETSSSAGTPATVELSNPSSKPEIPSTASDVDASDTSIVNEADNDNDPVSCSPDPTESSPDESTTLKNPEVTSPAQREDLDLTERAKLIIEVPSLQLAIAVDESGVDVSNKNITIIKNDIPSNDNENSNDNGPVLKDESATLPGEETESTIQTKRPSVTHVEPNTEPEITVLDDYVDVSNNSTDMARTDSSLDESPATSTDEATERTESNNNNDATASVTDEATIEASTSRLELNSLASNNITSMIEANNTISNDDEANSATEPAGLGVVEFATSTNDDEKLLESQTEDSNVEETKKETESPGVELGPAIIGENVYVLNDATNTSGVNNTLNGIEKLSDNTDEPVDLNADQSTVVDGVQTEGSTPLWAKIGFSSSPVSLTSDSTSTNGIRLNLTGQSENLATAVDEDTKTSDPTYNTVASESVSSDGTIEISTSKSSI